MKTLPDSCQPKGRSTQSRHRPIILLAGLFACLVTPTRARADLIINITEVGNDVVATANGTIDLTALNFVESGPPADVIEPATAAIQVGGSSLIDAFTGITGPSSFGTGVRTFSTATSGDFFGLAGNLSALEVDSNYTSGSQISGTSTWAGATFSSLGLNPGTYDYTWGSGATADSLTVQVGPLTVVPEPATIWLAAIGGAVFAAHARFVRSKKLRREGLRDPSGATE
jgi:hypothetical protein